MSSFTIDKKEYIKAAGILSGIKETNRDFWIYDYNAGKPMEDKEFYNLMEEFYTMNALSVAEQYHDDAPETDSNKYMDLFKEYKNIARTLSLHPDKLKQLIIELHDFLHSAIYQTEKDAYMHKMIYHAGVIDSALMPYMYKHEVKSWGAVDISGIANDTNYTPLF